MITILIETKEIGPSILIPRIKRITVLEKRLPRLKVIIIIQKIGQQSLMNEMARRRIFRI
jgi:hypothetical protein